jgi:hypothetical protein
LSLFSISCFALPSQSLRRQSIALAASKLYFGATSLIRLCPQQIVSSNFFSCDVKSIFPAMIEGWIKYID